MKVFQEMLRQRSEEMGVRPLARSMEIPAQSLGAYLLDGTEPRLANLNKMAKFFKKSVGALLKEVPDRKTKKAPCTNRGPTTELLEAGEYIMQLVTVNNGEARTTTLAIAEGMEVEHKAVIQLVRTYQGDLEEFGLVTFEMAPRPKGQHGGGNTEFALLNEQQSTLIMTYMKNTEIARAFKKRLVKAFYELPQRQQIIPQSLPEALRLAADLAEKNAVLAPKAAIADRISIADGLHGFREVAKILDINERKFKKWLIANNWIYSQGKLKGMSDKIRSGYLEHKERLVEVGGEDKAICEMFFTPKGLLRLTGIFNANPTLDFSFARKS